MITRRGIIQGLFSLIAAPAVIRTAQLMPVKTLEPVIAPVFEYSEISIAYKITRKVIDNNLYRTLYMPSNLGLIKNTKKRLPENLFHD